MKRQSLVVNGDITVSGGMTVSGVDWWHDSIWW
jgi:hypothetical protein